MIALDDTISRDILLSFIEGLDLVCVCVCDIETGSSKGYTG